jgi:hypothetical protein
MAKPIYINPASAPAPLTTGVLTADVIQRAARKLARPDYRLVPFSFPPVHPDDAPKWREYFRTGRWPQ